MFLCQLRSAGGFICGCLSNFPLGLFVLNVVFVIMAVAACDFRASLKYERRCCVYFALHSKGVSRCSVWHSRFIRESKDLTNHKVPVKLAVKKSLIYYFDSNLNMIHL